MNWINGLRTPLVVCAAGLSLAACASTATVSKQAPMEYTGATTTNGKTLTDQLRDAAPRARPDIVFAVGKCDDETGQFKDAEQLRYSRAVTQGCGAILANYLKLAGFKVRESDPVNLSFIAQEYQMSHTYGRDSNGRSIVDPATGMPKNIGLIQHGGPNADPKTGGGFYGANYLVTGAVISYASSTKSGGGGIDHDGIGASVKHVEATVGMNIRIVDISTGLTVSSNILYATVTGTSVDFHITRFIGAVATQIATVAGGGGMATVLQPTSNSHVWSGEIGQAQQLPVDYVVTDDLVAGLARGLEANQRLFYVYQPEHNQITFDYSVEH